MGRIPARASELAVTLGLHMKTINYILHLGYIPLLKPTLSSTAQEINIFWTACIWCHSLQGCVCVVLWPCHAGWYRWSCCTGAPGVCACWACLVLAGAGRTFAGSCGGRGARWGPGCWSFDTDNLVLLCAVALLNSLLSLENPKGLLDEINDWLIDWLVHIRIKTFNVFIVHILLQIETEHTT